MVLYPPFFVTAHDAAAAERHRRANVPESPSLSHPSFHGGHRATRRDNHLEIDSGIGVHLSAGHRVSANTDMMGTSGFSSPTDSTADFKYSPTSSSSTYASDCFTPTTFMSPTSSIADWLFYTELSDVTQCDSATSAITAAAVFTLSPDPPAPTHAKAGRISTTCA
jgi:hypothetical protein